MTSPLSDEPAPPLTPEALAVLGRARRAFAVSMLVLLLGFAAIAFALVYRSTRADGTPAPLPLLALVLPVGAELISAVPSEGYVALTYRIREQEFLRLVDRDSGVLVQDIPIQRE